MELKGKKKSEFAIISSKKQHEVFQDDDEVEIQNANAER